MSRIFCSRGWIDLNAEVIDPDKIDIDWAWDVLGRINRYTGQPPKTWTVQQHSILVGDISEHVCHGSCGWGRLHDLHEAYIGDVINPLARFMGKEFTAKLEALKHKFDVAIWCVVGTPSETERDIVKFADRIAFEVEWRAFAEIWPEFYGASVGEMFDGELHPIVVEFLPTAVARIGGEKTPRTHLPGPGGSPYL